MFSIKRAAAAVLVMLTIVTGSFGSVYADDAQYWPEGPQVQSESAIVMEANTGTILYSKNIDQKEYPASITKIMTTLLALENSKMDEVVTFSHDAVYNTGGSGIARDVGEQMTMEQTLYAVMLESANECAYAVGEHVANGDMNAFIAMMNKRAKELGCKNTNFNNCTGLPDENHYTTAYDMALIAKAAYQNENFRILCGTKKYTIPFTNKHTTEETYLQNHHAMLYPLKTFKYLYQYCKGGKTGYTTQANSTLVTFAEKDGMTLICVVMNAQTPNHYLDTINLFNFCFDNFKLWNISQNDTSFSSSNLADSGKLSTQSPFVALDTTGNIILPVTAAFTDAKPEILYDTSNADIAARVQYTYNGTVVGGTNIVSTNAVVEPFAFDNATESTTELISDTQTAAGTVNKPTLQIDFRLILGILAGIGLLGVVLYGIYKIFDNYYSIRRKLFGRRKPKSPYKSIKTNKMFRKHRKK